ncbi:MAG: L,D-transpeptidase [Parcubacteria group bacterium]
MKTRYFIIKDTFKKHLHKMTYFNRRKIAFIGLLFIPITSASTSLNMYIDNTKHITQKPTVINDTIINLDEHIHVSFAETIIDPTIYERSVSVTPSEKLIYLWKDDHRSVDIIPQSLWDPDTSYSLAFSSDNYRSSNGLSYIFSFKTAQYPQIIAEKIPSSDRYVPQGEEIILTFDRSLQNIDLQAVVRPFIQTEQFIDKENNELHIRITGEPDGSLSEHNLTLFAKYSTDDSMRFFPIDSIQFNAILPTPNVWPKAFAERLDIARRSTMPLIKESKYIDVNLDAQVTTLFDHGAFVTNFVNSPGAKDTPTPKGTYKIYNKDPYALSSMFQVYLPFWMAFTEDGEYGFHDLIVWPEGHADMPQGGKESIASIGNAVSPGCVRHDAKNSKYIYNWAEIGTPVVIH